MSETLTSTVKEDLRTIRTKRDLANALEELLKEKQFSELSVKDITDKAMVSKNTFYNNFQDKTQLLMYVFERYKHELMEKITPTLLKCGPGLRKIYFKKCLEILVSFLDSKASSLSSIIRQDQSKDIYWSLTVFVKEVVQDVEKKFPKLFSNRIDHSIIPSFVAGAFSSLLYFGFNEENNMSVDETVKNMLRLCSPIID